MTCDLSSHHTHLFHLESYPNLEPPPPLLLSKPDFHIGTRHQPRVCFHLSWSPHTLNTLSIVICGHTHRGTSGYAPDSVWAFMAVISLFATSVPDPFHIPTPPPPQSPSTP